MKYIYIDTNSDYIQRAEDGTFIPKSEDCSEYRRVLDEVSKGFAEIVSVEDNSETKL